MQALQVMSRALVHRISVDHWRNCEAIGPGSLAAGGADVRISHCLWAAGFGPTLPNYRPGQHEFEGCVFGAIPHIEDWFGLQASDRDGRACDDTCTYHVVNAVSSSIDWGRAVENFDYYEQAIWEWWRWRSEARKRILAAH
jgi:hypothetical protein